MNQPNEKNVILFDEVNIARLKTSDFFKEFFIEIHVASSETELFYLLSETNMEIDLIIFNDSFENNKGFEILSRIKDINHEIPILVLTSNDNKDTFLKVASEGICDYLLKPLSEPVILERVLKIINSNKSNLLPKKPKVSSEVAFDIIDYMRRELKKAKKGNFDLSLIMFKLFIPSDNDIVKNQEKYAYVSDLFYEKLSEILWDTDIIERTELNNFIGIFPFCGINNISKVYNKVIECFDKMKKSNHKTGDFHLVLTSLTYPNKDGSAEELLSSLELSIEREMKKINGLLQKFK